MQNLRILLPIVGVLQLILGFFYLFMPEVFLNLMGHTVPQDDIFYPLAMLASRFIAYGIGFIIIARHATQHLFWIRLMILIQAIDLGAGIYYTLAGHVPLALSGFPMFNALWIIALLALWSYPNHQKNTQQIQI